ncbi:heavy metal translocating P-type ATPase [Mangrovivirga cuniculi]|uniref:Heavy metal translocating P-type ATPase n=1 Tax=Mangrovivirga cuniculi TaxID=2715131 RepID=A0A4D7JGI3_9BACT|nr:heavy metal translocating P-type ATPase metal-binding domain-containing protein [Mangrovivirga cuniculi]QCK14701.1 heavy metal translocating P-type ATPase [Mangrovivirga cuniculi]
MQQNSFQEVLGKTSIDNKCRHCNDALPEHQNDIIYFENEAFCCAGCKTAFEILSASGLQDYYKIDPDPGLKVSEDNEIYDFLENEEIQSSLLKYSSEDFNKIIFQVPAIHCSSCLWLLENLYRLNEGVIRSVVDFGKKRVTIDYNPELLSLKELAVLLKKIGYPPHISLEDEQAEQIDNESRSLMIRIGVAGFAFGNIMLMSFPEYLGLDDDLGEFAPYFGLVNFLLAIPVFFYCSTVYFKSAWSGMQQKYLNIDVPVSIGIITLFFYSSYEVFSETGPGYFDSLAGLLFFLLTGRWFQNRTYRNLSFDRSFTSYFPLAIHRIKNDNSREVIPVRDLAKGDVIQIRNTEVIPVDCIVKDDSALIDYSFVTGESRPVKKGKGELIFAGGKLIGKSSSFEVKKVLSQSYLTSLWNNEIFNKSDEFVADKILNRVAKYFTWVILFLAFSFAIGWYFIEPGKTVSVFTAILIVACPCALSLTIPYTFGSAQSVLGNIGFYLRNSDLIEKLLKIDHIIFDKTGTLTTKDNSKVNFVGYKPLLRSQKANIATLCSQSVHPLSVAVSEYLLESNTKLDALIEEFTEVSGKGISGRVNDEIYKLGSREFIETNKEVPSSSVCLSINNEFIGYFEIKPEYRDGIDDLFDQLSKMKYDLSVLSGDNDNEKSNLADLSGNKAELHFNKKPDQKLESVIDLKKSGKKVLMVGDGLNDAGALKAANFGLAVTDQTTSFTPASDAIVIGKNLSKLPQILRFAKSSGKVLWAGITISLLYNLVGLTFAAAGMLTPVFAAILMPLSSITIVAFSTLVIKFLGKKSLIK